MPAIVLTGFMGTGKTTVGREVARMLDLPFIDLDERIEEASGSSIPDLFSRGEEQFRWWEQAVLESLDFNAPSVVATGGGALMGARNRAIVAPATVIVLDAPLDLIRKRVARAGNRPLSARTADLYVRRQAIYARLPHHIATAGQAIPALARQVIDLATRLAAAPAGIEGEDGGVPDEAGQDGDIAVHATRVQRTRATRTQHASFHSSHPPSGAALYDSLYSLSGPVALVTDTTVARLWGEQLRHDLLAARLTTTLIEIPPGESHKTLATLSTIYDKLLAAGIDRDSTVVALGGGVVGDIAGFAAATWMRGVRTLVQVPTTLLAMVDASIGGKTGVDLPGGKNLIGAFRQPDHIVADPAFLTTLPVREWRSGMAEVIKHAVIADPELFATLREQPPVEPPNPAEPVEFSVMTHWLERAMRVKTGIVARDPLEKGERYKLNLGHTFGHAYELLSGFTLSHGEAVAIGIVTAARLSERLGIAVPGLAGDIIDLLTAVGLPTTWRGAPDPETIWQAMQSDKKKSGSALRLVLPRAMGDTVVTAPGETPKDLILQAIKETTIDTG